LYVVHWKQNWSDSWGFWGLYVCFWSFSLNDGSPIFGSFQKSREVQVPEKQWEHWPRGSDPMMSLAHSQHCKLFFGVKITRNGAGRSNMWLTNW
jgi:hypothetical protein